MEIGQMAVEGILIIYECLEVLPPSLHSVQPAKVSSLLILLVCVTALESAITPPPKCDGKLCFHTSSALKSNTWRQHHNLRKFASVLQAFSKDPLCARPGAGDRDE